VIGPIDHVYLWVADLDAAASFYGDVLGFPMIRRAGEEWAEFDAGPIRLALHGVEALGARGGGGATAVFRVEDLDAARWQLAERGAAFDDHEGEVPGFARFATFRDPDGNPLQLIEYVEA
jgi:predicted enzyme related to lactoylglutathione lyase